MRLLGLTEIYSRDNMALLRYMQNRKVDAVQFWDSRSATEWLESDPEIEKHFIEWLKQNYPSMDLDDAVDDFDIVYEMPEELQKSFEEFVEDNLLPHYRDVDPANVPSWTHMYLRDQNLLPPNTWLIHLSYEAYGIAKEGFKYGMDDMDRLALTTWFKDDVKKSGGFNFAFVADSNQINLNYGKDAVLFQNSGVHAYHVGDEENQVMFWGRDVDPRSIILLHREWDAWSVMPHPLARRVPFRFDDGIVKFSDGNEHQNLRKVINWVKNNLPQYRRYITGY